MSCTYRGAPLAWRGPCTYHAYSPHQTGASRNTPRALPSQRGSARAPTLTPTLTLSLTLSLTPTLALALTPTRYAAERERRTAARERLLRKLRALPPTPSEAEVREST